MKVFKKKGFSLVELIIALSILIIMTGVAIMYLGDILYKAKVAKAKTDMEILVEALTLADAEQPTNPLDSGLVGAAAGAVLNPSAPAANQITAEKRDTLAKLVGIYLLSLPNDPWGNSYQVNSYAGWVKSLGEDLILSGTTKYDRDVTNYFLPENLFLAKIRAEDLNANTVLDTGDEVRMYFSKSVRCNLASDPFGTAFVDADAGDGANDSVGYTGGVSTTGSWDLTDIFAIAPAATTAVAVNPAVAPAGADGASVGDDGDFVRPTDYVFYASCLTRDLVFRLSNESGAAMGLDIGYDVYIPAFNAGLVDANGVNMAQAYAIWESTKGYSAYKTTAEKAKIYLQAQDDLQARRTLVWKSIVD